MKSEKFWLDILSGARKGRGFDSVRTLLTGLTTFYSSGLEIYLALEKFGIRRRLKMPVPTISIGNLTSGGTGKTPMTHYVARELSSEGFRPVILSRGHGGSLSKDTVQVSDGNGSLLHSASEVGDEAAALAALIPKAPLYVGKDRRKSARAAFAKYKPDLFILDDGLQYWQLFRELDIVLIDARNPFDNGYPLPRGLLREPKEHLSRAGMIVITRSDLASAEQLKTLETKIARLAPNAPVFRAKHEFAGWRALNEKAKENAIPDSALAICGIAQPDAFFALLKSTGIALVNEKMALPDHAKYDSGTLRRIAGKIKSTGAKSIVTTGKDAVKIDAERLPVAAYVADLGIEMDRPDCFRQEMMSRARLVVSRERSA